LVACFGGECSDGCVLFESLHLFSRSVLIERETFNIGAEVAIKLNILVSVVTVLDNK